MQISAHCVYPCGCGTVPVCRPGVPTVRDGCGCCWQCAGQAGELCDGATICDVSKNLTCIYDTTQDLTGTCQEVHPAKCTVNNRTYDDGENFTLDCRTQCTCQNGTYACVSLCPSENIPPSAQCHHPHLVTVPGQCCREWMCDTAPGKVVGPPDCERVSGRWSRCSLQKCGAGVSLRWSTDNARCQLVNQTRLCQLRPCQDRRQQQLTSPYLQPGAHPPTRKHHIRRGHTCKATQRHVKPVRLRAGWCVSERRYRPKLCGACTDRCCTVHTSTTISIAFLCPLHANTNLLAAPDAGNPQPPRPRPHAYQPTTHAPSVYDMMDEGQPVLEAVLTYPQRQHRAHTPSHNPNLAYDDNLLDNSLQYDEDDLDDQLPFEHENLTVEDDVEYDDIKSDNYEIVHYQVEWIMRCKCNPTCDTYDPAHLSPPPPSATHTPT
ncbi:CCN family member 2-like 2 [Homarus americanus]|uniref:CCN family member 2-like 2 n=1 Tax=Homarus americanus TaxID=6706 RepID=A0A8J5T511_HOMAM|nr:CCN family member 2-like 2 [Homarus americanus]